MWWIKKKKKIISCKCVCHLTGAKVQPCELCRVFHGNTKLGRLLKSASPRVQRSKTIAELDVVFSDIIRFRDNFTCIKCGRQYLPTYNPKTKRWAQKLMTNSHYFRRGPLGTRWEKANCDAMCLYCHQAIENAKREDVGGFHYEFYKRQQLGENEFNLLEYKYSSITRFSLSELMWLLDLFKKELEDIQAQSEISKTA